MTSLGARATLSISSVHAARIGGKSGSLSEIATGRGKSLLDDPSTAVAIADQALAQISFQQARVGVFSSIILDTAETTLKNQDTSLTAAISFIEDADGALETALLVQNQLLSDNIASALAISTTQNANVIGLLQQVALSI